MPMSPVNAAWMAIMAGCMPRYSHLPPMAPADLQAPLTVQHADVNGVDIAYIDSGPSDDDGLPVIFVHGLSSYMGFWEYQIPEFARQRRVLALDLPGYGASARPDAPFTPPWYAEVITSWMASLDIERAVVVGHSMGGQIAITMALEHPDQVGGLVLSAPAGIETFDIGAATWMKQYWHEARATEAREVELRATFSTLVFNNSDAGVERLLEERVRMGRHESFQGTSVAVARSVAGMLDHPVADRLGDIQAPTLVIYGTDDHMIPNPIFNGGRTKTIAKRAHDRIPGSELVMLAGAGHTVHHDDPEGFNKALSRFLAQR